MKQRRTTLAFALGLACLMFAGCYRKVNENGAIVITYETWVPLLVALIGVVLVPAGILLFSKQQKLWGVILTILGPVLMIGVAPGMFLDRVTVDQKGFTSRHGFWWAPQVHDIRYDELKGVRVVVEEKRTRRGRTYSYYFDCSFKSGKTERVPLGDVMKQALGEVVALFNEHGVQVQGAQNLPD